MRYVVVWGDEWQFEVAPAFLHPQQVDTYVTKAAGLNAALAAMHHARGVLNAAIKRADKKQRNLDRYRSRRDDALSPPFTKE